ncbi:hypothetical protein Tdes44962_MAKER04656 [Teratosphaeria destructans]|uniref:Uncharacterized protein n=1 Tax=Teratosphaeria destructans TaxID=418781 RepID=A0A9W7SLY7_9PEZI|nr:hypothetical protein Tdes44962_MAKER04656 [Teratosphaeria destructans]
MPVEVVVTTEEVREPDNDVPTTGKEVIGTEDVMVRAGVGDGEDVGKPVAVLVQFVLNDHGLDSGLENAVRSEDAAIKDPFVEIEMPALALTDEKIRGEGVVLSAAVAGKPDAGVSVKVRLLPGRGKLMLMDEAVPVPLIAALVGTKPADAAMELRLAEIEANTLDTEGETLEAVVLQSMFQIPMPSRPASSMVPMVVRLHVRERFGTLV